MAQTVKILIEGPPKSGKTTIATLIRNLLVSYDLNASYENPENPKGSMEPQLELLSRLNRLIERDVTFEIIETHKRTIQTSKD
jgi:Holliday junction resolvasome RuvABC ATP-dependent DNA helicase subunit